MTNVRPTSVLLAMAIFTTGILIGFGASVVLNPEPGAFEHAAETTTTPDYKGTWYVLALAFVTIGGAVLLGFAYKLVEFTRERVGEIYD